MSWYRLEINANEYPITSPKTVPIAPIVNPCMRKMLRNCRDCDPMDRNTAMSLARSVTVIESTTKIFKPATSVISPIKMAVTNFYWTDYAGGRLKYFGGAFNDRNGPCQRHRCVAVHGIAVAAIAKHFSHTGIHDWSDRHRLWTSDRILVRIYLQSIPAHPARSPGLCGTLCSFPPELGGRSVDFGCGDGNFTSCDVGSGQGGRSFASCGNPSF